MREKIPLKSLIGRVVAKEKCKHKLCGPLHPMFILQTRHQRKVDQIINCNQFNPTDDNRHACRQERKLQKLTSISLYHAVKTGV